MWLSSLFHWWAALRDYDRSCGGNILPLVTYIILLTILLIGLFGSLQQGIRSTQEESALLTTTVILWLVLSVVFANAGALTSLFAFLRSHHGVMYPLLFTMMATLTYVLTPADQLDAAAKYILPLFAVLGLFAWYTGLQPSPPNQPLNPSFERLKMVLLLASMILFYSLSYHYNPGDYVQQYAGYSLPLAIAVGVFALAYMLLLFLLPSRAGITGWDALSTLAFFLFFIIMTACIYYYNEALQQHIGVFAIILLLLLVIAVVWLAAMYMKTLLGKDTTMLPEWAHVVQRYQRMGLWIFGTVLTALIVAWIARQAQHPQSALHVTINVVILLLILTFVFRTLFAQLQPSTQSQLHGAGSLLWHLVFYIPCLLSWLFDLLGLSLVKDQLLAGSLGTMFLVALVIALLVVYIALPDATRRVQASLHNQGGTQLVNDPVPTDSARTIGSYPFPPTKRYAITFWYYLPAAPPNTSRAYTQPATLFQAGNLRVSYHGTRQLLRMETTDLDGHKRTLYETKHVRLQTWTHVCINAHGETVDVFIDNALQQTSKGILSMDQTYEVSVGQADGVLGSVCNVVCFGKPLTLRQLYYNYHTVHGRSPPTLMTTTSGEALRNALF